MGMGLDTNVLLVLPWCVLCSHFCKSDSSSVHDYNAIVWKRDDQVMLYGSFSSLLSVLQMNKTGCSNCGHSRRGCPKPNLENLKWESLSHTHSLTHTHSHTHAHTHTHTHSHTLTHTHALTFTHTHTRIHSHKLSHTLTHTHTHTQLTHTHTLAYIHTHTHTRIHSHTHTLTQLTHTHSHTFTHTHTRIHSQHTHCTHTVQLVRTIVHCLFTDI